MTRLRMIPIIFGIGLLALTLLGANNLIQPAAPQDRNTQALPAKPAGPTGLGPVVNGVVASEVEVGEYVAPYILPLAQVKEVYVKAADVVTVGQPLIKFDDTQFQNELVIAQTGVSIAKTKLAQSEQAERLNKITIDAQQLAVDKAENDLMVATTARDTIRNSIDRLFTRNNQNTNLPWTQPDKDQYLRDHVEYQLAKGKVDSAQIALRKEKMILEQHKLMDPKLVVNEAKAEVEKYNSMVKKAESLVSNCVLRSGVAGIVDRVTVTSGSVVALQSQKPSIIIIPSGPRLVRAEVVPEFAHKLASAEGRKVIIYDNDNFNLTYEGTVERVGNAFLPRRFGSQDLTALNANRVLECTIRVTDPAPAGKPPLLVGQPVRVSFP